MFPDKKRTIYGEKKSVHVKDFNERDLLEAIDRFRVSQVETGRGQERRIARARREVESIALAKLRAEFPLNGTAGLDDLAKAVSRGELDPYAAANRVLVGG